MSDDVVAQAKAALDGVTAEPWLYIPGADESASVVSEGERSLDPITVGGVTFYPGFSVAVDLRNPDAVFIAAARSFVPALVAEIEQLREEFAAADEQLNLIHDVANSYRLIEDSQILEILNPVDDDGAVSV